MWAINYLYQAFVLPSLTSQPYFSLFPLAPPPEVKMKIRLAHETMSPTQTLSVAQMPIPFSIRMPILKVMERKTYALRD